MNLMLALFTLLGTALLFAPLKMLTLGHKWRQKDETITSETAGTIDFSTLIPDFEVGLWTFIITGTNNGMAGTGVDGYQGKLGTGLYLDMKPDELRSLLEFVYSRYGGAAPATTDLTWCLPFHLLNILIPDLTINNVFPEVGLPADSIKIWQMFVNAASCSGGLATLGWVKSQRPPSHLPYLVGHAVTGLAGSVNDQPYRIPWQALPTAGMIIKKFGANDITRIRLYTPDAPGLEMKERFDLKRDQILQLAQPYSANAVTDPICIGFGKTITPYSGSYFLLDMGSSGAAGTMRFTPIQFVPIGAGVPTAPAAG